MRPLTFVLGLLACGCGEPLVERSAIVDTRVLAARAEVDGDPTRATPSAGERVLVQALVAGPEPGPPPLHWQLDACIAEPTTAGLTRCRSLVARQRGAGTLAPSLTFVVPTLPAATQLAVVGIACDVPVAATGEAWPSWFCSSGKRNLFSFELAPQSNDIDNHNPTSTLDTLALDGELWPTSTTTACDDTLIHVASESTHALSWSVALANREPLDDGHEAALLSHFTTGGTLERSFSRIESDDASDPATVSLAWTAPRTEPGAAQPVTLYFVHRDRRGGTDWMSRTLCVDH